jgi:hypothetical protein
MVLKKTREYDIGDRPTFRTSIKNPDGVLTTPTSWEWRLERPDGTMTIHPNTEPTSSVVSAGVIDFTPPDRFDTGGEWTLRFNGLTGIQSSWEETFFVRPSAMAFPI